MVIYIQHKEGGNIVFHRAQAFNYLSFFHVLPTTVSEKIGPKWITNNNLRKGRGKIAAHADLGRGVWKPGK